MLWKRKTISSALVLTLALIASVANADYTIGTATDILWRFLGPSVSTDGLTLYLDAGPVHGGHGDNDIWISTRDTIDDEWSWPVNAGPLINSSFADGNPDISDDGLTLFFNSRRPGHGDQDIWFSTRATINDPWSEPENIGSPINGPYFDAQPNVSTDGLSLYFSSTRPGGQGAEDTWLSTRATTNDPWSEPVNLGPIVNSPSWDRGPDISSDGLKLFFDSDRPGGYGEKDIWLTTRTTTEAPWSEPVNLGSIVNSPAREINVCISADGSTLYFFSQHIGHYLKQAPIIPTVDFNGDDLVDAVDMSILIDHWHTRDPLCDIGPSPLGDGRVDIQDMIVLSEHLEPGFGRIAHWKLDETEGDIAHDSIGSDHADVYGDAAWQPESGKLAGALEFDGIDDYVAPMCIVNPADGPFRILAWIKDGAPGQVIASQTPAESGLGGVYLAADPADGTLMTEAILPVPLKSNMVVTDREWHHVGLEWDGDYRHLYLDDTEVAVDDMSLPGIPNTGYLNIGAGKTLEDGTFWSGLIDDVRVYNRVVTP